MLLNYDVYTVLSVMVLVYLCVFVLVCGERDCVFDVHGCALWWLVVCGFISELVQL